MRDKIELKTEDNHVIYGTLDSSDSKTLLIFVHGYTGSQNEHHYFNAVPFFTKHNFDTFRFDFYSKNKNGRSLSNCSLTDHSNDLNLIIKNFKDKYDKLIVIGHSLGGLVILKSDLSNVSKIILWDPTTPFKDLKHRNATYDSKLDKYVEKGKMDFYVGKELFDEWMSSDYNKLVTSLNTPCKIIFAGNNNKFELWQPYLDKFQVKHELVTVENATHGFIEEGTEQRLFEETLKWIE